MAFRDLFDSDKRSKDELRSEIRRRDEQIAALLRNVSDPHVNLDGRADAAKETQSSARETEAEPDEAALALENRSLRATLSELENLAQESEKRANALLETIKEREEKNLNILRELENQRRLRHAETAKNREEYRKLLNALNLVKQRNSGADGHAVKAAAAQTPAVQSPLSAVAPVVAPPPHDRTDHHDPNRMLLLREERVEAMERQFDALLTRFGITDKSQAIDLPAQLTAIEQELGDLRKSTEVQELLLLRQQVEEVRALAKNRADERDEIGNLLSLERQRNSINELSRVRSQLDEAQIEIKRLKAGTSDEVWNLRRRAENAEKRVEDREFEFRNQNLRIQGLEETTKSLKVENDKIKANTVSRVLHRAECEKLERTAELERNQTDYYRTQSERSDRELHTAINRVERLKQELEAEKKKSVGMAVRGETSFTNPTVMRWLVDEGDPGNAEVPNGWLGRIGEGPWSDALLAETLEDIGYEFWKLPDPDLRHLIVGRRGWTEEDLISQIDAADGEPLRIYSQEMFLAKLITGRDPFESDDEALLLAFAKGHPALEFLLRLSEPWSWKEFTGSRSVREPSDGDLGYFRSPLYFLGYHVGVTSNLSPIERRRLLQKCLYEKVLDFSADSSSEYRENWGRGGSAQRLYRTAMHIQYLTKSQGKDHRKPQARTDWESDLKWLKENFYHLHKRRFPWPDI